MNTTARRVSDIQRDIDFTRARLERLNAERGDSLYIRSERGALQAALENLLKERSELTGRMKPMETTQQQLEQANEALRRARERFRSIERGGAPVDGREYRDAHKEFLACMDRVAELKGAKPAA